MPQPISEPNGLAHYFSSLWPLPIPGTAVPTHGLELVRFEACLGLLSQTIDRLVGGLGLKRLLIPNRSVGPWR